MTMRLAQTETLAGVGLLPIEQYKVTRKGGMEQQSLSLFSSSFPLCFFLVPALNLAASRPLIVMLFSDCSSL